MEQPTSVIGWIKHYLQGLHESAQASLATGDLITSYLHSLYESAQASVIAKDLTVQQDEILVVEESKPKFIRDLTIKGEAHIWGTLIYKSRTMTEGSRFVIYEGGEVMLYA